VEEPVGGRDAAFFVEACKGFDAEANGGIGLFGDGVAEALFAKVAEAHAVGNGDEADMAVALCIEQLESFAEGCFAIGIEPVVFRRAIEQATVRHGRKTLHGEIGETRIILGDTGNDHAIGTAGFNDMAQNRQLVLSLLDGGEEEIEAVFYKPFAEARDELSEIGVDEMGTTYRHEEAHEAAAAGDQLASGTVWHIAKFAGGFGNALTRLEGNLLMTGKGAGDCRHGQVQTIRELAQCLCPIIGQAEFSSVKRLQACFCAFANALNFLARFFARVKPRPKMTRMGAIAGPGLAC
jgi:hypothetical protein